MRTFLRSRVLGLASFGAAWVAASALAQAPNDMTYTGRLVDDQGTPLAGPVDLELRVFDAESGPTQLYSEEHPDVALDASGGFAVQLGLGANPSGAFDAALFSEPNRWLEVVVDGDVLSPRQIVGSVPWALIAQQANEIVPDPSAPRFEDCGDGTVADRDTGLLWEQKTGTPGSSVECATSGCADPHEVNNTYQWSEFGASPDGGAFEGFVDLVNDSTFGEAAVETDVTGCLAGRCDWRLPTIAELTTILDCAHSPCIDPIFGPSAGLFYWSASTRAINDFGAWYVHFGNGMVVGRAKTLYSHVRAVRIGTCR